jgi:type I restriction enzyme R subunit
VLNVASGGVFTTIQKFLPEEKGGKAPELSKRRNILVIADEAHRSQYDLIESESSLCAGTDEAIEIRDDIGFFQQVKIALAKPRGPRKTTDELDHAVRQLVAKAIAPEGEIIDVFQAAGLKQPDISILSDQFLAEVRGLKYKNVAAELLAKLLTAAQQRPGFPMLKKTLNAYHNRAIATQEVIEELIKLAKQLSEADERGVDLGLNDDEVAFYDALAANNSALEVMGRDNLKVIATELVTQVRKSVTIDWTLRESACAKIKVLVKRILRKHGYPPDLQDEATKLVLQQAELLCVEWAA